MIVSYIVAHVRKAWRREGPYLKQNQISTGTYMHFHHLAVPFVILASALFSGHKPSATTSGGATIINPAREMKNFELKDHENKPRALADFSGKWTLVFFGFSSCSQVCPSTLAFLNKELAPLGEWQKDLSVLFITVDPDRDTPEKLMNYVQNFNPHFTGLFGEMPVIEEVAKDFGAYFEHLDEIPEQQVDDILHSSYVYLLNRETKWHALYRTPMEAGLLTKDLKKLL